ncbi:MAG: universal stress protein [Bacteroidales bacterium]
MKKLLIALDYDPTAQKVAETGFSLAKTLGAEVFLIHVISEPVYYASREYSPIMGFEGFSDAGPGQTNSLETLTEASLHFLEKTKAHLGDENIHTLVIEGEVAETITKTAQNIHADLIVMGSHSRKWLENIVMGSVTEKVLQHTTLPLFIIPTKKITP